MRSIRVVLALAGCVTAASAQNHWVATWADAAAPQLPSQAERVKAHLEFENQTIREIIHTSMGGNRIRIRLSNVFNSEPVQIGGVYVAACTEGGRISLEDDHAVKFSGLTSFTIPSGAPFTSDPLDFSVAPASDLCISIYLPGKTTAAGIHYDARQKNYIAQGNKTAAEKLPDATVFQSWVFLAGVDVLAPSAASTIVAFGDSITDGAASTVDANRRWPNVLADRLNAAGKTLAVVDEGIGGNRILHDARNPVMFGVNALARFQRDAVAQPGAKFVIVLEGINDLGHAGTSAPISEAVTADDLIAGLKQMVERAHEHQVKIFGATLTSFEGASPGYYTPEKEKERVRLNDWIRTGGAFDGVIDFEKAVADSANPKRMKPEFDSGDHLHPNDAGYRAMAESIDLALFQ